MIYKSLLLLICGLGLSWSQNTTNNQLMDSLDSYLKKDTIRVNLIYKVAFASNSINSKKLQSYADEMHSISDSLSYELGIAKAKHLIGYLNIQDVNYEDAKKNLIEANTAFRKLNNHKETANSFISLAKLYLQQSNYDASFVSSNNAIFHAKKVNAQNPVIEAHIVIGHVKTDLSEYDSAIKNYSIALDYAKDSDNEDLLAECYNGLGAVFVDITNLPKALENYNNALGIYEFLGDDRGKAKIYSNLGGIYFKRKEHDKALNYYQKSLKVITALDIKNYKPLIINNIAIIYNRQKKYDKAITHYKKALDLNRELKNKHLIALNLNNLANTYTDINQYDKALKRYHEALSISLEIDSKLAALNVYIGMSKTYFKQKRYEIALSEVSKAKNLAESIGSLESQSEVYNLISKINAKINNFENAYNYHLKFKSISDSIFNKETLQKLTALEYEYLYKDKLDQANKRETKLIERVDLVDKKLDKSNQQKLWITIALLTVIIFFGVVVFSLSYQRLKSQRDTIATEQKLLRSQMTPHFIFNALSVIQGMILSNENKKAADYLSKFSRLIRLILENSRSKLVSLTEEIEAIKNYLELHRGRLNKTFNYNIAVDNSVPEKIAIPPMVIQPFVENAIEHGFKTSSEDENILELELKFSNDTLFCTIRDNGIGINAIQRDKISEKKSLSTTITLERLNLLAKELKKDADILIEDRTKYNSKGTIVTLKIPYKL